jgi:hypothetical protein
VGDAKRRGNDNAANPAADQEHNLRCGRDDERGAIRDRRAGRKLQCVENRPDEWNQLRQIRDESPDREGRESDL